MSEERNSVALAEAEGLVCRGVAALMDVIGKRAASSRLYAAAAALEPQCDAEEHPSQPSKAPLSGLAPLHCEWQRRLNDMIHSGVVPADAVEAMTTVAVTARMT